jgi:hypothetical protein
MVRMVQLREQSTGRLALLSSMMLVHPQTLLSHDSLSHEVDEYFLHRLFDYAEFF